jgi:hypothetical protein
MEVVMKTLANEADAKEIRERLASLTGDEQPKFGRMTVGLMLCHVREAFEAVREKRQLTLAKKMPVPARVMKYLALKDGAKWPAGVKTTVELEPGQPGVIAGDFAADRDSTVAAMERFRINAESHPHPFMGAMSADDWLRWGYLHADHHLRQFGR